MLDFTAIRMQCFALILSVILLSSSGGTAAAIECYQCHGSSSPPDYRPVDAAYRNVTSGGFQGNHRTHLGPGAGATACSTCHPSSGYTSSHRNGRIDLTANINNSPLTAVYRNGSSGFSQTPTPRLGSCNNVNCHFERTSPVWGNAPLAAPGDCGACHGAPRRGVKPVRREAMPPTTATCPVPEAAPPATAATSANRAPLPTPPAPAGATWWLPSGTPAHWQPAPTTDR